MAVPAEFDHPFAFDIRLRTGTDGRVLDAVGELDHDTGPLFNAAVDSALDTSSVLRELVIDMSRVAFCDSCGLNALIRAHLKARETGMELHLLNPTGPVAALLRRTGVNHVLRVSPDPAEARSAQEDSRIL
ncbi:STAS domain-containing protein [Kitasatospora sp. NPDC092286]|uniref:STAS domain-containing protein n=1 Tax=Kitasatospora sp. NPDC092286 TaxID=3364087 RepID=UPI003827677B